MIQFHRGMDVYHINRDNGTYIHYKVLRNYPDIGEVQEVGLQNRDTYEVQWVRTSALQPGNISGYTMDYKEVCESMLEFHSGDEDQKNKWIHRLNTFGRETKRYIMLGQPSLAQQVLTKMRNQCVE